MEVRIRHIFIRILLAFAAVPFTACRDVMPAPSSDDSTGRVSFRVVTPKTAQGMSKATWGDDYVSQGSDWFETALLVSQLSVLITDNSCTEKIAVTKLYCENRYDSGTAVTYEYIGIIAADEIDRVKRFTDGKLHIIANAGISPVLSDDASFALAGQPGDDFSAIPMWGVRTIDFSGIENGQTFSAQDVYLLRAMAKVEVARAVGDDNFITALKSVTITSGNSVGYLLPDRWNKVADTKKIDRDAVRVPAQAQPGPMTFASASGNGVGFYIPESGNSEENGEIKLTVTYETQDGEELSSDISFRPYTDGKPDGKPFDILRNHLYRFTVSMLSSPDVKVIADVEPYTPVELEPVFGI